MFEVRRPEEKPTGCQRTAQDQFGLPGTRANRRARRPAARPFDDSKGGVPMSRNNLR